jgi:hypothetical protein
MHRYFESFDIFHTPSYQSKYPPAQAAFLAVGKSVTGMAVFGVWLSFALACAATTWMLRAFFSRAWAMTGGLLGLATPQIFMAWGQSYWGGAVAWLGAALLLGGMVRFLRRASCLSAGISGLGLFILANSRPVEAVLLCGLLCPGAFWMLRQKPTGTWGSMIRCAWPLLLWVGVIFVWTGFYNFSLTGHAWTFPHVHFARLQPGIPSISWTAAPVPMSQRTWKFFYHFLLVWPVLTWLILFKPARARGWAVYAILVVAVMVLFSMLCTASNSHYYAPLYPLLLSLSVWALQRLSDEWGATGRAWGRGVLCLQVFTLGLVLSVRVWNGPTVDYWANKRNALLQYLEAQPGETNYLVLVEVDAQWPRYHEVVYNRADIDSAKVVFARSAGEEGNQDLLAYFPDREVVPIRVGNAAPAP